jgi:ribosomal protein S6--L-glutamate ligase
MTVHEAEDFVVFSPFYIKNYVSYFVTSGGNTVKFCFIIEEQYANDSMPTIVSNQLLQWGHTVDILVPQNTITSLSDLPKQRYDAYVLKTVSDGPGLSILEAAEAAGIPTINRSWAIRRVRDKTIAVVMAGAHGIPMPATYFIAHPRLLNQVPAEQFPLVVKPTNGSSCRLIYYIDSPSTLEKLDIDTASSNFWLAQHYEANIGFDTKLYVAGTEVFAAAKRSPLHPEIEVEKQPIAVSPHLRTLALEVGRLFGLDIYGLDVVETDKGPMVVDINDFPSFGNVPEAEKLIASCVIETALRMKQQSSQYTMNALQFPVSLTTESSLSSIPIQKECSILDSIHSSTEVHLVNR